MVAMVEVQILKKGVPAMSMAKNLILKTGKKTDLNISTAGVKLKIGGLT